MKSATSSRSVQDNDSEIRAIITTAAQRLDSRDFNGAREHLQSFPLTVCGPSRRAIALALWKRILLSERSARRQNRKHFASSSILDQNAMLATHQSDDGSIAELLDKFNRAITDRDQIWNAYHSINPLESILGAPDTATIARTALWEHALTAEQTFFEGLFELFYRAGGDFCSEALELFLQARTDYIPIYWHFVFWARAVHRETDTRTVLEESNRLELVPLFEVYAKQMRQYPTAEIIAAARALTGRESARAAEYMVDMPFMPADLPIVAAAFGDLIEASPAGHAALHLMQGRLAVAEKRWREAISHLAIARMNPRYQVAADIIRAQALTGLKQTDQAIAVLDEIVERIGTDKFLRARATFQRLATELVVAEKPLSDAGPMKQFPATSARPLAQSLWVGSKLRWIERLAIKSFLDNGWRFQLYTYDDSINAPEGCEIMDASVIIPELEIFKEGADSGLHAGSIGAFSDLFRYQLLYKRGGMWTDTDVINLKLFDPDGKRFVCTEISDASLVTLNGAIMAAPAGDPFLGRAGERARQLLATSNEMFFTRIGPYLLTELLLECGTDAIDLMPPKFLSPISWMNSASLLQPFDVMMAREEIRSATNLHVYTETWRALSFDLNQPPHRDTFLGRLYFRSFGED